MANLTKILVAVDQFPQDRVTLMRAAELARAHSAKLMIVHIADVSAPPGAGAKTQRSVEKQVLTLDKDRIESEIQALDLSDINLSLRTDTGSPALRIADIAKEFRVDLIVMRAHQRRSIRERLVGSTADRVLRSTPSSVLIVKRPVENPYRNVAVAVDFLAHSECAAIRSSEICIGTNLVLVHVIHVSARFEQALRNAGDSEAKIKAFKRQAARYAKNRMRDVLVRIGERKPRPRTRVISGDPAKSLVQLTRNDRVDMIAVGPFDHSVIRLALLGSVTHRLIRDAGCDVLISRPPMVGRNYATV